jgi:hypothetical protein
VTSAIRWRIITLQVILILVLGFCAGFLFWGSHFINGMIHDELVAQKIFFPPESQIKPGGALDPAVYSQEIRNYAGQQVDTGQKAKVYADDFIGVHLNEVAGGQTYSQVSAKALADPTNATLAKQAQTLFQGETLRGLLLNTYGWSQLAMYAFFAAIGLTVAALVVLGTLIYELAVAPRGAREPQGERVLT